MTPGASAGVPVPMTSSAPRSRIPTAAKNALTTSVYPIDQGQISPRDAIRMSSPHCVALSESGTIRHRTGKAHPAHPVRVCRHCPQQSGDGGQAGHSPAESPTDPGGGEAPFRGGGVGELREMR